MTNAEDVKKVVEQVEKDWGPVNILVNNAGIITDDLFVRMEPRSLERGAANEPGRDLQLLPGGGLQHDEGSARGGSSISPASPPST